MYSYYNQSHSEQCNNVDFDQNPIISNDPNYNFLYETSHFNEVYASEVPDFPDACLKFINDILMEEDLEEKPENLQDYHALQATEKSLYDALGPPSCARLSPENSDDLSRLSSSQCSTNTWITSNGNEFESNLLVKQCQSNLSESSSQNSVSVCNVQHLRDLVDSPISTLYADNSRYSAHDDSLAKSSISSEEGKREELVNDSRGRKNHQRKSNYNERSNKQIAFSNEEYVEMEKFDDILICKEGKDDISPCIIQKVFGEVEENPKGSKNKQKLSRGKRKSNKGEVVDLRNLLIQCAQAATSFDHVNANELLKQIRQHSSDFGDSTQRVAYYFANALEARLAGTGSDLYRDFVGRPISSSEILKGYQLYVSAVPFQRTSYFLANQTIGKFVSKATKIHIIDFGIFFGFQWPCLIQFLSQRQNGPPRVKITGVDFPKSGFKPAQIIEETGNRLAGYCKRFGVPFEFHAVAQRWHTLKPENFKIEKDELLVVSCLYQSRKLPDESVDVDSPRDCFLKTIRNLNPHLFIHGVVNGTFNAPFFITRFREALYHYSALFDVFEATMPREEQERLSIERLLYGKDVMNIVACEGSERIERPESYKQWQMRHKRVGFTQVGLDQEVVNRARAMVKANYHKDIMVDQDGDWMVQGWKGRILSAVSCWKPA